jgi:hypothetical protein
MRKNIKIFYLNIRHKKTTYPIFLKNRKIEKYKNISHIIE